MRKVYLKEDWFFRVNYKKGDVFTIIGDDPMRGWDLQHDKTGNKIYETRFSSDKFEMYSLKQERWDKLKSLNILNKNKNGK